MKKRISIILVFAMMCAMLSGCMAEEIAINFNADGSGKIEVGLYYSDEFYESLNVTPEEMLASDENEGAEIVTKKFNGEQYTGLKAEQEFTNITSLYTMLFDETSTSLNIVENITAGKHYVTISGMVPSDETLIGEAGGAEEYSEEDISNILIATMDLTFPGGITSVSGIGQDSYRINGNTIHIDLVSKGTSQNFSIMGCLGNAPENYGLENFKRASVYNNNFKDVAAEAWYAKDVARMYEYEIVAGTSETTFTPNANLSLAQIITMASRAHAIYSGYSSEIFVDDNEETAWYVPFVMYAYANGIVERGIFDEANDLSALDRAATRAEMAYVMARCLPTEEYVYNTEFAGFNDIEGSKYTEYINRLGYCGITVGIGEGKFAPDNLLNRAQAVVFMSRLLQYIPE